MGNQDDLISGFLSSAAGVLLESSSEDYGSRLYSTVTVEEGAILERRWIEGEGEDEEGLTYVLEECASEETAVAYIYDPEVMTPEQRTLYFTDGLGNITEAVFDDERGWNLLKITLDSESELDEKIEISSTSKIAAYLAIDDGAQVPTLLFVEDNNGYLTQARPSTAAKDQLGVWMATETTLFEQTGAKPAPESPLSAVYVATSEDSSDLLVICVDSRDECLHQYRLEESTGTWTDSRISDEELFLEGPSKVERIVCFSNGDQTDVFYKLGDGKVYFVSRPGREEGFGDVEILGIFDEDGELQPATTAQNFVKKAFVHLMEAMSDALTPKRKVQTAYTPRGICW